MNTDNTLQEGGTITYANEVIAIIAGVATSEIEGIAGMVTSGGFGDIIGKNKNITRGVKVEVGTEEVSIDLYTIVEYGQPIQKVASEVQENVRKSIEAMTGLKVVRVDVHVQGVSFEKERREVQQTLKSAQEVPVLAEPEKMEEPVPETEMKAEAVLESEPVAVDGKSDAAEETREAAAEIAEASAEAEKAASEKAKPARKPARNRKKAADKAAEESK